MRFHKYNLALIILLSFSIIAEAATNLPKYHPLREDREVLDRPNSVRQFSYNVNKKFEGVSDRFGNGDLDGAMQSLESMLEWNLSKYEKAVVYQFMGFVFVQQNKIDDAIKVFSKTVDLNVLSNTQHQSTQFNLASLYGSREEWDLTINALMKFYEFEREPVAESYIMTGIAYFQKGLPLEALPYIHIANEKAIKPRRKISRYFRNPK